MREFTIIVGQRGGVPVNCTDAANEILADAWIHAWAKVGGSVTIGADGNTLHPWVFATNVEPFKLEEVIAARLINELTDTSGLPLAVRDRLSMVGSLLEPAHPSQIAWKAAYAAYLAARGIEQAYERDVWKPEYDRDARSIPDEIELEMERLTNAVGDIEDKLLDIPAVDGRMLAQKYLIFFAANREANWAHEELRRDASRLAGVSADA